MVGGRFLGLFGRGGNLWDGNFVCAQGVAAKGLQYFLALGAGYMLALDADGHPSRVGELGGQNAFFFCAGRFFLIHLFEPYHCSAFSFARRRMRRSLQGEARRAFLRGLAILTRFLTGVRLRRGFWFQRGWAGGIFFAGVFS